MLRSRIIGVGSYVPEKRLTNADLEKIVDTNDEWITSRSGIKERRIAAEDQCSSDLALAATRKALEMAGLKVEEIDLIVVGTATPDMQLPSMSESPSTITLRRAISHPFCVANCSTRLVICAVL